MNLMLLSMNVSSVVINFCLMQSMSVVSFEPLIDESHLIPHRARQGT